MPRVLTIRFPKELYYSLYDHLAKFEAMRGPLNRYIVLLPIRLLLEHQPNPDELTPLIYEYSGLQLSAENNFDIFLYDGNNVVVLGKK